MAKIADAFSLIRNGANIKQGLDDSGYPITRIETISDRTVDRDKMGYAGITDITKYSDYVLQDGDILMSHINSETHLGKVARYEKYEGETIIHGMNLLCLRPNKNLVDSRYAFYYLSSEAFLHQIPRITKKSVNQASFNVAALKELTFPISSMEVQQTVADILDKANELIALRKEQLAKLDELVKARFVELFGDPKINPNKYPVCQLSEHIAFLTSGSRGWAQYYADDGTEWFITIRNVKDCHIETDNMQPINAPDNAEAKRTRVQEGDLLISITADLGRTGVVTKEIAEHGAYINQHLTCIRLKQDVLNPLYVAYFMESPAGKEQFESKNQSAVKAGLNFNSINSLRLMVPPLEEQNAFVNFVEQVDKSKVAIQKALDEAQLLFDSLMQKYFG